MRFKLGHPNYPQYAFNLFDVTPQAERRINRLSPVATISRTFDWPQTFGGFRGWTDTFNSLWWPRGAEQFATCVLVIDDARNDLLTSCITAQRAALPSGQRIWPYLILSAYLAPEDNGLPAEGFAPRGVDPVLVETELMGFKLYPLTPINVSSLDSSNVVRGLWLLPLVDIRYFMRNVPLNGVTGGSSGSGAGGEYPIISVTRGETPDWMPPLRAFPQDQTSPVWYTAIANQGTVRSIGSDSRLGKAADAQAAMQGWRIVNRDVRTNYNRPDGFLPHNQFTGVVTDYPENWSLPVDLVTGYHLDAIQFLEENRTRYAGGMSDVRTVDELMYRKIQFVFDIVGDTEASYSVTLKLNVSPAETTADFSEDFDGPDAQEKTQIPVVYLGPTVSSRDPGPTEHAALVTAAKQWFLIYCYWRREQAYIKFPGIYPVIPNGHAQMIRWDFRSTLCETTYIAVEGVEGFTTDRPGGGGTSSSPCIKVVLTAKTYNIDSPWPVYEGYHVTESENVDGGLTYALGDVVDLPIYNLSAIDLVIWNQDDTSTSGPVSGQVPEECVCVVCRGAGDFYTNNDQPRMEIVKKRTPPEYATVKGVTYEVADLERYNQVDKTITRVKTAYILDVTNL